LGWKSQSTISTLDFCARSGDLSSMFMAALLGSSIRQKR
jgi:hypothetical protein